MTTADRYTLPALGYEFDALEPAYSSELLELHYKQHHRAYVKGANETLHALAEAREAEGFDKLNELQRNLAFNVSGHLLHSIFWCNVSPVHNTLPPDTLSVEIRRAFGDFDALRGQFLAAGTGLQGSGWAALSWEPVSRSLTVEQIHDHQGNVSAGSVPLLVMDMWEHAFYLQYRNEKQRWAKAFWDLINWQDVGQRLIDARAVELRMQPKAAEEQ